MTNDSLTIWTIGHSTHTIEEFIDMLLHNQIEILVDVRKKFKSIRTLRRHKWCADDSRMKAFAGVEPQP